MQNIVKWVFWGWVWTPDTMAFSSGVDREESRSHLGWCLPGKGGRSKAPGQQVHQPSLEKGLYTFYQASDLREGNSLRHISSKYRSRCMDDQWPRWTWKVVNHLILYLKEYFYSCLYLLSRFSHFFVMLNERVSFPLLNHSFSQDIPASWHNGFLMLTHTDQYMVTCKYHSMIPFDSRPHIKD